MGQAQYRTIHKGRGFSESAYTPEAMADALAGYLGTDQSRELAGMANYDPSMLGELWTEFLSDDHGSFAEFYSKESTGRMYLYDLANWNASQPFKRLQQELIPSRNQAVLEIRAGIGTVAIQLGLQDNDVIALELNHILRNFASERWSNTEGGGSVTFVGTPDVIPDEANFDLVVAIDTFEHMDEHELRDCLGFVSRVLKRGGRLFCHNTWGQQDIYPMHSDHADLFDQLTQELGIVMTSPLWGVKT
jgi:ubiquinone/menaquinone biosynthesis C-methylase UbiE